MKLLCFIFLNLVAVCTASSCVDKKLTGDCEIWNRLYNFCKRSDAYFYCAKTCKTCTPSTTAPPPTQTPANTLPRPTQKPGTCGVSTVQQGRVVNGVNAQPGAWPWITSLQGSSSNHFCGGTIITPTWVLTASHCVEGWSNSPAGYTVTLGAQNIRQDEQTTQTIKIRKVIMHEHYSRNTLRADVALIQLESPAQLNDRVALPCLPQKGVYPSLGKNCYIAGWGTTTHPGNVASILQQAKLPVVASKKCRYNNEVVCVGKGFKNQPDGRQQPNACRGDSGGPLVCQQSDGRWQLEGVASFVYTYCKYYTGYSPVNKYLPWIQSHISA